MNKQILPMYNWNKKQWHWIYQPSTSCLPYLHSVFSFFTTMKVDRENMANIRTDNLTIETSSVVVWYHLINAACFLATSRVCTFASLSYLYSLISHKFSLFTILTFIVRLQLVGVLDAEIHLVILIRIKEI